MTILNEKFRPTTLEGFICDSSQKEKFQEYLDKQDIPHIGLFGKAGSGKTTLAKILANNIDCDYLYINATDERSMDIMREKVGQFASSSTFKPMKIIILDEATHILQASQVLLLNMIETFSKKTRFILTGNYPERLIEPLRSRLQDFKLLPPSKVDVAKHLIHILEEEKIQYENEDVKTLILKYYPDIRRIINMCQKNILKNVLKLNNLSSSSEDYKQDILNELCKKTPNWLVIRQIIANSGITSFEELYAMLYSQSEVFAKGREGQIAIIINEHLYQETFVIDKEITFMSCISKIIEIIKQKPQING